jgi:hypothetical protein
VIAKITRGSSFKGAARYVLDERRGLDHDHQPEIIGGNMAGRTSGELTREFEAVRQQRPDIGRPVEHVSLSLARDERQLSNDEMALIAEDYVRRRGYDPERCQYVVVRHHDKEHQHCHILVNRVRTDRTVVPQQYREYLRNKETCRALERDYRLRPVRSERLPKSIHERAPSRGEDRMKRDRGMESEKEQLKALIREAAAGQPTMREFVRRLEAKGVQVRANIARTGHVSGISYRLDHVAVKGSGLGRGYSFEGLQREQGVRYDPLRDRPDLERALRATQDQEPFRFPMGRRGRLPVRSPRLPGERQARALLGPLRDLRRAERSPEQVARDLAIRALPPAMRQAIRIVRTLKDVGHERGR